MKTNCVGIARAALLSIALSLGTAFCAHAQSLIAVNDTLRTGPLQKVRKDIIYNDATGEGYTWSITSTLNPTSQGTAVQDGNYIVFTPGVGSPGTAFDIHYKLTNGSMEASAVIHVIVRTYNTPINQIDFSEECISEMPASVGFQAVHKFDTQEANAIDGYSIPLVGDLNGDGKPEIIGLGVPNTTAGEDYGRWITIFNGQTGALVYKHQLYSGNDAQFMIRGSSGYNNSPCHLAIADLDNDGLGEIVVAETGSQSKVYALKPQVNLQTRAITGLTNFWSATVGHKSPLTDGRATYGMPMPYVADLNADGIPEVIVYNKIYHGRTGVLLMAYGGAAPQTSPASSNITATRLSTHENANAATGTAANANAVRDYAYVGRRVTTDDVTRAPYLGVISVADVDVDGDQEIIAGMRAYHFTFNSLTDHTQNRYYTVEGPQNVTAIDGDTYNLTDGYTRVADMDGDGLLDAITVIPLSNSVDMDGLIVVWNPNNSSAQAKAVTRFYSDGTYGTFSIPFVGDINKRLDGYDGSSYSRKLPEICITSGRLRKNDADATIDYHPRSNFPSTARWTGTAFDGHVWALTYDAAETNANRRLKLSWALEHEDSSDNTGITVFDFDNDGAVDLCYRDCQLIRVISPAKGTNDYVGNGNSANAVLFSQAISARTGPETAIIADTDFDGSADIVTTHSFNVNASGTSGTRYGVVRVFTYRSGYAKWAPCPPVWNQGLYHPLQINEDLTVPARPQSMLATSRDAQGNTFHPYNGQWLQQPIVRDGERYVPQVRLPDAEIMDMSVEVLSASQTKVTLSLRNGGSASINTQTPIAFYNGGSTGRDISLLGAGDLIQVLPVGVDIFPDERVTLVFTLNTPTNLNSCLVWARIMDSGSSFPATGYVDCDMGNNTFSGSHCQELTTSLTVTPDSVLCSNTDKALLRAESSGVTGAVTYRWYLNGVPVPDSTSQTYHAGVAGEYKCFITAGPVCRGFTPTRKITREIPVAVDDTLSVIANSQLTADILDNDLRSAYCNPAPEIQTPPLHGSAVVVNDSLRYTPNAGFVGQDSLTYSIGSNVAKVRIIVYNRPDNIVDEEGCFVEGTSFTFLMRMQTWSNTAPTGHNSGTLVGDLDGDGLPEIIAYNSLSTQWQANAIQVYNGQTGALKASVPLGGTVAATSGWQPVMTAALVDADGNGKGEIIFIRPATREVASYEVTTSSPFAMGLKWTGSAPFDNPTTADYLPQPIVADFNGDGTPEVVVYNRIYNAATGAYLGYTESSVTTAHVGRIVGRGGNQNSNFLTTADFDGDGLPEIAAGGKVYKVSFNTSKTAVTCSIWKQHTSVADGFTAVADVDMDGNLDLVVVNGTTRIQVWTPATGQKFNDITVASSSMQGYPFVGDIDGTVDSYGKRYPEICVTTISLVSAFKYNSSTKQFVAKWTLSTTDTSGGTGITLFDFNNDGVNEIVYRDETQLRVLNGVADATPTNAATPMGCTSGTAFEYPVIADTDGDGSANICITCAYTVRVFESNTVTPWSTTRKVWNQVNYEPLQINEDLTAPQFVVPKNTTFGSKQPYNGALIQVPTMVNTDFDVVQISPDPAVDSVWVAAVSASTSRVWVRIANRGVKNTNAALPVAIYNTDTPGTAFLQTKQVGAIIAPGGMYDIYFDIPSATMNIIMSVRLQDTGTQYPAPGSFLDCNYANNTGTVSGLLAVQDYYLLPSGRPSRFDVRDNDFLSSCGRGHLSKFDTIPGGGLRHGSLTIGADSVFTYTPANNFLGVDSVTYYIKCLTDSSSAKAYLLIQRPRSLQYVACQNASVVMGFDAATGVQYYWFNAATGGSVVSGGSNANTLTVTKTADPVQTWWVEARYGSIIFPRYRVDLELSDNCGTIDPVGCAAEGTVLYRGDFGGNNVSDPLFSATPLPAGTTTYGFVSSATPADGQYTLLKNSPGSANAWFAYEDHTLPESNRGYFMLINADYTPALFYTTTIRGLCENTELYFSAWAGDLMMPSYGASIRPKLRFVLQDAATLETLASYTTSEMPLVSPATWRLYGFGFTNHSDSLKLSIYNDAPGGNGNDLVLDDIEIRFCAPRVELQPAPFRTDTVVRAGTSFAFEGAYTDDGTFGASLVYRWEHNLTGNMNDPTGWAVVPGTEGSATGGTVHSVYNISSVTRSDSGYYRLAVADAAHINAYNCRAMSDIVRLRVLDGIRSDSVTIQEFQAMEIDILANDALPASLFTSSFNLLNAVIQQPHAGVLSAAGGGTGADSRLYYVNQEGADGLTGNIDSFRYEFTFYDVDVAATVTVNATVYIYVLQNRGGFSVCRGEPFTVRLAEKPAGVYFEWFTDALPSLPLGSGAVRTLATVNGDSAFLVRPVTPIGAFPVGQLTVRSVDPSATGGLRWTGTANSRWYYPGNWVELRHEGGFSFESPALWTPVRCVDVTLPSGMVYYPELVDTARCRCISVKDRALLVNPHVLVYDSARVEINLLPTERDRFVMWSAPLKDMYSGDYHFKGAGGQPYWGDTYMNFFQRGNPEGGASQANTFTATFGLPNVSLELGTAFNLKLTSTTRTKGAAWVFPQPDTYYTDAAAQRYPASGNLRRIESHRFVTDGVWLNPDRFQMNIFDSPGYDLVQVVNPYLAWLDVSKFLAGNSDRLSPAGYLIWSGHVDENFSAVSTAGNRLVYTHPPLSLSPGLIPPLQSFFVQKITPAATYAGVYMSPKWTTTSAPQHSYVLRAEAQENGVLRIRATQSGRTAYALLHYLPQAVPEYRSNEDIRTLFYNELPLTVYTLGTQGEPLAINASGSFGLSETPLTVRVHSAGEVRLDFTGMESFGHDVYLIDREAGREIDLQETPYCTFVVTGASGGATEISNRFFLKMNYTGRGLLTDTEPEALLPDALFSGEKGHIRVRALSGHMRRIEIYNPLGMPVYVDNTVSEAYDIPVAHAGVYIVKVQLGERTVTRKVLVGDQ